MRAVARRYARRPEQVEELVQIGAIGLIKAVDRFDPDRGVQLSTYAVANILGELKRHFRDHTWAVHVGRRGQELALRLEGAAADLTMLIGRSPTIPELAEATDADVEEVVEAMVALQARQASSLDGARTSGARDTSSVLELTGATTLVISSASTERYCRPRCARCPGASR